MFCFLLSSRVPRVSHAHIYLRVDYLASCETTAAYWLKSGTGIGIREFNSVTLIPLVQCHESQIKS